MGSKYDARRQTIKLSFVEFSPLYELDVYSHESELVKNTINKNPIAASNINTSFQNNNFIQFQIGFNVLVLPLHQNHLTSLFEIVQNLDRNEPFMEISQ